MHLDNIPAISESTLSALHSARLRTVSNVLSLPFSTLLQLTSLSPSSLRSLLSVLHSATAARAIPALSLLSVRAPLSSGSPALDSVLSGGLHARTVAQLAGPSGSGKTQAAMSLAASALRVGGVVWLDSSSTHAVFSRVSAILAAQSASPSDIAILLRRLVVLPASTVDRGLACLRALRKDIVLQQSASSVAHMTSDAREKSVAEALARLRLVVFDSVANVLAPVLGLRDGAWSGHVALNHLSAELRWFASHADASVLITNRVVRDSERTKPALGNSWTALIDVSLGLEPITEYFGAAPRWDGRREQVVVKANVSSKRSCRRQCQFQVCGGGLSDVDQRAKDMW